MIIAAAPPNYANQYYPARLVKQAASSVEPKGAGRVTVQVLVHPNGTFKVIRVIRSTNPGDNAAALDIARRSKYAPASKGGHKVQAFYDFSVSFGAQNVSAAAAAIDKMLVAKEWAQAKAAATQDLATHPDDQLVQAQLGVADAFAGNIAGAVAAFDKAGTIAPQYAGIAMQAYALNATSIAEKDPKAAVAQAQRAVALGKDYDSYYALGVAEYADYNNTAALAALKTAQQLAKSENPPAPPKSVANIDEELMLVYMAQHDNADAQKVAADLNATDPTLGKKVTAYSYDMQAAAMQRAKNYNGAIAMFRQAAKADPQWAGATEYTKIAILYASEPIPDYLNAKAAADKAIADDGNFALAYYIGGVALYENALTAGNANSEEDANIYLRKAHDLAQNQGNKKLAKSAAFFEQNHALDANLQFWSTQLSVNPRY